jgi:hypothetical protein
LLLLLLLLAEALVLHLLRLVFHRLAVCLGEVLLVVVGAVPVPRQADAALLLGEASHSPQQP